MGSGWIAVLRLFKALGWDKLELQVVEIIGN
jgi:hypothetical protein